MGGWLLYRTRNINTKEKVNGECIRFTSYVHQDREIWRQQEFVMINIKEID